MSIDIQAFKTLTMQYPNRPFINYLIEGITKGFRFNFSGTRIKRIQINLKSVSLDPSALGKYIQDEMVKGRICGLFTEKLPPCDLFQVNPCGLVVNKDMNPKVYRVISHLSAPFGSSIVADHNEIRS